MTGPAAPTTAYIPGMKPGKKCPMCGQMMNEEGPEGEPPVKGGMKAMLKEDRREKKRHTVIGGRK